MSSTTKLIILNFTAKTNIISSRYLDCIYQEITGNDGDNVLLFFYFLSKPMKEY